MHEIKQSKTIGISLLIFFICCSPLQFFAQNTSYCALDKMIISSSGNQNKDDLKPPSKVNSDSLYYIRVVVHVLKNNVESITEGEAIDLIDDTNKLLRAEGLDFSLIKDEYEALITDTKVQLCLANLDPAGNPTSGINLYDTGNMEFEAISGEAPCIDAVKTDSLGGVQGWDNSKYLNIWIANIEGEETVTSYGLPYENNNPIYSQFGNCEPGIVMDYTDLSANFIAHEVGHVLGLLHTFHITPGPDVDDICDSSDFVEDTPRCAPTFYCGFEENTCFDTKNDKSDNQSNIMNYGCILMFTPKQTEIIRSNLVANMSSLIIDNPGCSQITSSIDLPVHLSDHITISPNPNNGSFAIYFDNEDELTIRQIKILDHTGRIVHSEIVGAHEKHIKEVNCERLMSGLYLVQIETNAYDVVNKKIIIF